MRLPIAETAFAYPQSTVGPALLTTQLCPVFPDSVLSLVIDRSSVSVSKSAQSSRRQQCHGQISSISLCFCTVPQNGP